MPQPRTVLSGWLLFQVVLSVSTAIAAWQPLGTPICTAPGLQAQVSAVSDGSDGAYVIWNDSRSELPGLYVHRITADGTIAPGWPVNGLRVATFGGYIRAAPDNQGGCFVVWRSGSYILGVRILPGGLDPSWPVNGITIANAEYVDLHGLAVTPSGDLMVLGGASSRDCIPDGGCTFFDSVFLTKIAAGGARLWDTGYAGYLRPRYGALAADLEGGAWVIASNFGLRVIHVSPTGGMQDVWPSPQQIQTGEVAAASSPDGGAIICWPAVDPRVQKLLPSGNPAPGWPFEGVRIAAPGPQLDLSVLGDGSGGAVFAWLDWREGDYVDQLYAMRLGSGAESWPGWPQGGAAICDAPGNRGAAFLAPGPAGGLYAAWQDRRSVLSELYALHLSGSGEPAPGWPDDGLLISSTLPSESQWTPVVADGRGGALVFWPDVRDSVSNDQDVYGQRLPLDITVPVLAQPPRVEARPGFVSIRWMLEPGAAEPMTVERRLEQTEWETRGPAAVMGRGSYDYRETAPGGRRVGYRLVPSDGARREPFGEVWVDIPPVGATTIQSVVADADRLAIAFTLPAEGYAVLEVFDLSGRAIARSELAGMTSGQHTASLTPQHRCAAGVYVVRLRTGNDTVRKKFAMAR